MPKEYDFYNLSENIKATTAVLSHLSMRASCYSGDYTKAGVVALLIKGLLANIESLIEAAQAIQNISRPITADILKASAQLKHRMFQYKADLESCSDGNEEDIGVRRPSNIHKFTIPHVIDIANEYHKIMCDLRWRVEAESQMKPASSENDRQEIMLHEFIKLEIANNIAIFKSQVIKDGLALYRQRYEKSKEKSEWEKTRQSIKTQKELDVWLKNNPKPENESPTSAPLGFGNATDEKDRLAMSSAALCALHDLFLPGNAPSKIPQDWPENLKQWLKETVTQRYQSKMFEDTATGWGQTYKSDFIAIMGEVKTAIANSTPALNSTTGKNGGQVNKLSKEAKVLAILTDNPKLSDTEIAEKAGINRTSLYRMGKFVSAREILKSSKADFPKGSKSKDGDIEAFDE